MTDNKLNKWQKKDGLLLKIGRRIEKKRLEMRLSKSEFAALIGTSRPQLERIVAGEVNSSILRLKEICEKTGMPLVELVSEK